MAVYAYENNDQFPTACEWCDLLIEHAEVNESMLLCDYNAESRCQYALNKGVEGLGAGAPGDMVLLFESDAGWNAAGGPELQTTSHHEGEGCNVLFVDSHVEFVHTEDLGKLKWTAP
jgi:prepilin-type processing-associated H-X9-DG protein